LRLREELDLNAHVRRAGDLLRERLSALAQRYPAVFGEVRGHGLMLGLAVRAPYVNSAIADAARERALLVNAAGNNSLRFVPPLIVTPEEVAACVERLGAAAAAL
jgi:acetylornithine/succinyldiaminopimelate/putrescine aminotransferase